MKRTCNDPLGTGCETILSRFNEDDYCGGCQKAAVEAGVDLSPPDPSIVWTPELIHAAIRTWALRMGRPPKREEWHFAVEGQHPCASTVRKRCGTWSQAIIAAGYDPYQAGRPRGPGANGKNRRDVLALLADLGPLSSMEIATRLGRGRRATEGMLARLEVEGQVTTTYDALYDDGRRRGLRFHLPEQQAEAA